MQYFKRSFVIDIECLRTEFNPKFLNSVSYNLVPFKKHKAVKGSAILLEDIGEFFLEQCVIATNERGRSWKVYNITMNGCNFIASIAERTKPWIGVFQQELRKVMTGLPTKCPIKKVAFVNFDHKPRIVK